MRCWTGQQMPAVTDHPYSWEPGRIHHPWPRWSRRSWAGRKAAGRDCSDRSLEDLEDQDLACRSSEGRRDSSSRYRLEKLVIEVHFGHSWYYYSRTLWLRAEEWVFRGRLEWQFISSML